MAFTFIHTADWQIGSPFSAIGDDAGAALRDERFAVVRRIAALASERAVDAVLVAGDVFDSNLVETGTIHRLLDAMQAYGGPWVMLPGNHDAAMPESVWDRLARIESGVSLHLATKPSPLALADDRAVVLPAPLTERRTTQDLTLWMDEAITAEGVFRLGLAHGSMVGYLPEEEGSNPIAADRARLARLDYLALGDWHGTRRIDARSFYAGTPEPDRAKDNDSGNVLLVRIERPGAEPEVEILPTGRYRWYRRTLDVTATDSSGLAALVESLATSLGSLDTALLWLRIEGSLDGAGQAELDRAIERLKGRLRYLSLDDASRLAPSADELMLLEDGSLLGRTAARLRDLAAGPEGDIAALALRFLWQERSKGAP